MGIPETANDAELCPLLWKSALVRKTSRIPGRNWSTSKKKNPKKTPQTFLEVPRELPFPQKKLVNIKERPTKISWKQQTLREHIEPLFKIEVITFEIIFSWH